MALVRYAGAGEWYKVRGAPVRMLSADLDRGEHERAHKAILARVTAPATVEAGNELTVDLRG